MRNYSIDAEEHVSISELDELLESLLGCPHYHFACQTTNIRKCILSFFLYVLLSFFVVKLVTYAYNLPFLVFRLDYHASVVPVGLLASLLVKCSLIPTTRTQLNASHPTAAKG
jgi:hypothetical protein